MIEQRYSEKQFPIAASLLIVINTILFISGFKSYAFLLYLFSHAEPYHLIINMLVLWIFGSYIEARVGWKRFLLYYFLSAAGAEVLWKIIDGRPLIGASGAISGLIGMFFYRCHYLKVRPGIPVRLILVNINIHGGWILYYWLIWHIYSPLSVEYNAAYLGGLVTGVIIGKVKGKAEDLYDKAAQCRDNNVNLTEAEKDLLEALKLDPENPDINLEIARLYSCRYDKDSLEKGRKYYLSAAHNYYLNRKDKSPAGKIFLEYLRKYREPTDPQTHLKYASLLSSKYDHHSASQILEPLVEKTDLNPKIGDKIFMNYIHYSVKAGMKEHAEYAYGKFRESFPGSVRLRDAELFLNKSEASHKADITLKLSSSLNTWWKSAIDDVRAINLITSNIELGNVWGSDLLYWMLVFVLIYFSPLLLAVMSLYSTIAIIIVLPFVITLIRNSVSSFIGGIYAGREAKSEEDGLKEFNLSFFMDKAKSCEIDGEFDEAITYLRGVLKEDRENLLAQYKIARIYHKNLNRPKEAILEYRKIIDTFPTDHPFRRDAVEGIEELAQDHPGKKQQKT
jgi:membrane associated rhomboid family serine protease